MVSPLVLIVGAGPTGMTAAIELKRAGLDVRIVDKSGHMAQHSQALVVQARTLEQLQRYGIADEAVARGRKLDGARFYSDGKLIVKVTLDEVKSRYPYALFLPQSDTEALLNECMEGLGVKAERMVEMIGLEQKDAGVGVTLRHADGATEQLTPRWVIGCDGAHSTVREKTGTAFEGVGVGLSFFVGDMEVDGPDAPGNELTIHVKRGDVVFMGRMADKLVRLIIALHEEQDNDLQRDLTIEDFQRAVDQVGVQVSLRSPEWMTPFRVNDRQAERYRIGNVFLAGDASHIHSPVGGQGMNTGIQDVANLAWKLAAVTRGAEDRLLDSYDEERGKVGKALLRFTERGLKIATTTNPMLQGARDALAPLMTRLHPIQQAAVGFISETGIEYRSSSIVSDHGGDGELRAGDRLPDFGLRNGARDTTLLKNWTRAEHLAFVLSPTEGEIEEIQEKLERTSVVALDPSQLDEEGRRLLGKESKIVILRPDGYVGFRGPANGRERWMKYARQDAIADGVTGRAGGWRPLDLQ